MDDQAPVEAFLVEYRKIVGAVKQAAVDLIPVSGTPQDALKTASYLMMAMLPSNNQCCELFSDDDEETIDGEGWKKGRTIEEDDE